VYSLLQLFLKWDLPVLPKIALNSWAHEILLPQPPEQLGLQAGTITIILLCPFDREQAKVQRVKWLSLDPEQCPFVHLPLSLSFLVLSLLFCHQLFCPLVRIPGEVGQG
jgi:hypothetical protein